MFEILFIIAHFFATLLLSMSLIGSIQNHKLKINSQIILSMLISLGFVFLVVSFGLLHPLFFAFWGLITAGTLIYMFPTSEGWGYNIVLAIVSWMFWPQTVAFMVFNLMFVDPILPGDDDGD